MERFSISILRQQVYNICRLCGVDNPDKISILGDEDVICITETDEPTLAKKIEECVGIQVYANDQMPQNICSLCVDKVNDFYEYRLMCASTNIQTRTFLNLPLVQPSISLIKHEPVAAPAEPEQDDKSFATLPTQKQGPKTRNRKKQLVPEEPANNAEDGDYKSFSDAPSEKRVRYEHSCQYCNENYNQPTDLERHLVVKHTPLVHKFGCGSCMEYFDTASEYKDHNLWHKLTRTAFSCFRCGKKCVKIGTLNKHIELSACVKRPRESAEVKLVPDMCCPLCQKVFKTRNLYEWHGCFMRARGNCPKCGKYFLKKNLLTRHFMLYCTGSLPLMEPTYMPKNEPGCGTVNGVPTNSLARGSTVLSKRGRGRPRISESMKEETLDLPFPPLFDLPDFKSEGNLETVNRTLSEETLSSEEVNEAQKRASLVEETNKITTLLRSGESVDGNTDIATISSMLSSVNEAIANISKVRKKKKKRDRGLGSVEGSEKANPPMVVLSMANVKQEVHEDPNGFVTLTNSASVGNEINATALMDGEHHALAPVRESDQDAEKSDGSEAGDNVADSFADRNDSDGDSSDVEIISVENYQPTGASNTSANGTGETGSLGQSMQPMVQIKQEQMATDDGEESDFEGYEDASMFVAVKQEPSDEPVATEPNQPLYTMEKHSDPQASSYQALRIKIKKEKGLLNASVIETDVIDPLRTPATKRQNIAEAPNKKSIRVAGASGMNVSKPVAKRNSFPPSATHQRPVPADLLMVPIKQEPLESSEQLQENITTEQYCTTDNSFADTSMVTIKQEPLDDNTRPECSSSIEANNEQPPSPTDVVAFDGMRIKQERGDTDPAQQKSKKAFNPLSLTGVRLAGSKKSANNNLPGQASAHKSSVMINPFALLKQKESVPSLEGQESGSKENDSSNGSQQERSSLPVITQVKSIDPVEHLSLTSVTTAEAEPTSPNVEQSQIETTAGLNNCDGTNNTQNTESSPSTELNDAGSEPANSNNMPPKVSVSELKIASVSTITEDAYDYNSEQRLNTEQPMSTDAANGSDGNETLAAVSQVDGLNDETSSDAAAGDCSELADKDLLTTFDPPDDEMRQVEEEPKPVDAAEETNMVHEASPAAERMMDENVVVQMEHEQEERNSSDIVASESTSNIDTTAVSSTVEPLITTENEREVNINPSTTAKDEEKLLDVTIEAETHAEPPGLYAVAGNDEVLVPTEQCTT